MSATTSQRPPVFDMAEHPHRVIDGPGWVARVLLDGSWVELILKDRRALRHLTADDVDRFGFDTAETLARFLEGWRKLRTPNVDGLPDDRPFAVLFKATGELHLGPRPIEGKWRSIRESLTLKGGVR